MLNIVKIELIASLFLIFEFNNEEKKSLADHRPYDHSSAWCICNAIVLHQGSIQA